MGACGCRLYIQFDVEYSNGTCTAQFAYKITNFYLFYRRRQYDSNKW